jgi:hypothetical protein
MSGPFAAVRDAIAGLELPYIDQDLIADCVARVPALLAKVTQAQQAVAAAKDEDGQLFPLLEGISANREMHAALDPVVRMLDTAHQVAVEAERSLRIILARAIHETGAPAISAAGLTADIVEGPLRVQVEASHLLPARYWRARGPEPNRQLIREDLLAGGEVPGAFLERGEPYLRLTVATEPKE